MDPCPFLRIVIKNLALKFSTFNTQSLTSTSCYCRVKIKGFNEQVATVPIIPQDGTHSEGHVHTVSACFNLTRSDLDTISKSKPSTNSFRKNNNNGVFTRVIMLKIDVYTTKGHIGCGFGSSGKLLGTVSVPLELSQQVIEGKTSTMMQNGWVVIGEKKNKGLNPQLYLNVKAQPDPRFVFEFDGEPECSPQVFQVQGNIKQPVFTCKFSFRHSADHNLRSSSAMSETSTSRSWLSTLKADKDHHHNNQQVKEHKGWSITVHDLSGSPVAAASMVTPFVPSQGSDKVSRSNPGAWLILRPGDSTWKPWGRLEAWRERIGPRSDGLGYRFELLPDASLIASAMGPSGITLAQSVIPTRPGGKFSIDITTGPSPAGSPNSSFDFGSWSGSGSGSASSSGSEVGPGSGWWPGCMYKGFVMSSTIGGEGKSYNPKVEVGAQHVTCTEDAAAFVALAAAIDLSMDACRPFSQKLRKELRQQSEDFVV